MPHEVTPTKDKNGTFILFSTTAKLTSAELKKVFKVKKGKLICIKRKNRDAGYLFDKLIAINNSVPDEGKYFNFDDKKQVTHIYSVAQRSCTKSFALLKYFDQFLGGYDVNLHALNDLDELIDEYQNAASFFKQSKNDTSLIQSRAKTISQKGIVSNDKINYLIGQLQIELDEFSKFNLDHSKEMINLWRAQHQWTDIESEDKSINDSQDQLAA